MIHKTIEKYQDQVKLRSQNHEENKKALDTKALKTGYLFPFDKKMGCKMKHY